MNLRFVAAARAELYRVARTYDRIRPGLGDDFLADVSRAMRLIRDYPAARIPMRGEVRRYPLSRFPYGLLYAVDEEQGIVFILAVGHLRRGPGFWMRRARRSRT